MSVTRRSSWTGLALVLAVLAVAAPGAPAQSPSEAGYGETPVVALPVAGNDGSGDPASSGVAGAHRRAGNDGSGDPVRSGAATAQDSGAAPAQTLDTSSGRLPFTGTDLGVIGLAAAVLLAAGIALRRVTRPAARA